MKKSRYLFIALAFLAASSPLFSQELNVLVIGSTHSFSERESSVSNVAHEKPFNPTGITVQLQSMLAQDPTISDTVNVVFEDVYKNKQYDTAVGGSGTIWDLTYHCYSMIQHFVWPEGKASRMANLRGEGTYTWDYIILCGDPYIMANFPGVYAEGVKMIQEVVAQSANPAQIVLLAQWPENSSDFSADDFDEVVTRVGRSAGLWVAPAGKAWADPDNIQDNASSHPTPNGEYLAAAAIYSRIFNRSSKTSAHSHNPDGDAIADLAHSVVQAHDVANLYSGAYTVENAFQMKYYRGRQVDWNEYGSSTEEGFANGFKASLSVARISSVRRTPPTSGNPVDLSYSRGSDWFEAEKQYSVDAARHDRVHGFPMGDHYNTGSITMRYGIDKRYYSNNRTFENGTDLGIAYSMVRESEIPLDVRGLPVRLLWSKIHHFRPDILSHRDGWHLSNELDRAVGAYLLTLLTGRCPVEAEPADPSSTAWKQWFCRKLGYETAWQMAHLTTRAPGFRVLPSATSATTVSPTTTETMTVQFVNPPQADVTVTVSSSESTAAIVSPKTLVFTPSNYNIPQQVKVAGTPGATLSESFDVVFNTSSDDKIYNQLSDAWSYTNNRSSTVAVTQVDNGTSQVTTNQYTPASISLNVAGANANNTTFAGASHGAITWSGSEGIVYTPDADYLGTDQIVYAVTIDATQTLGCIDIMVELPEGQVNAGPSDAMASEEGPDSGTFVISRMGATTDALNVFFSLGGTAVAGEDYALSHSSPITIPAGQSSVMLTLTPVDDSVFGERNETALLSITADAAYPIGLASTTITISDNDNHPPVCEAGPDQTIYLNGEAPWTPTDISLAAWYDASDAGTIRESSGAVSQWDDKSGNGLHLSQIDGARQPVTGTTTINGANAVNFTNHEMATSTNPFGLTINDALVIAVHKVDNDGNLGSMFTLSGTLSSRWQAHVSWGGTTYFDTGDTGGSNRVSANYGADTGDNVIASFYGSTTDNVQQVHKNGSLLVGDASGHSVSATGNIYIGSAQGSQYQDTSIGEMVIINGTVSVDNRQRLEGYLAHKWALEASLPADHPHKDSPPSVAGGAVPLAGSVDDVDGDPLTHSWSVVSGPGPVVFSHASALDSSATFIMAGTYVLRLAADDGYGEIYDEVTITANSALPTIYSAWAGGTFTHAFSEIDPNTNVDGDLMGNMMEFAFGTDPTLADGGGLAMDGSSNGQPMAAEGAGNVLELYFVRRDDYGTSGSVSYTVQFSTDLGSFTDSVATPTFVADSSADSDYEVVKVAYPVGDRFGRIKVEFAP